MYFTIALMLLALVFRGLAFEFRFWDDNRRFWDHAFCIGSGIATFAQGDVLGAFIRGGDIDGRQFAGSAFAFLTPFSLLTGVALIYGYGLLGAGWLILKTEGGNQDAARRQAWICLVAVLLAIAFISVWTPLMSPAVASRWLSLPNTAFFAPVPLLTAVLAWTIWRALDRKAEVTPVLGAIGLFALSCLVYSR